MKLARTHVRRGMSLVELMVVVAIILILMALTAGATLRFSDVQRKRVTEQLLQKIDSSLRQHWTAAIAQARDEAVPAEFIALGGGDIDKAKYLYTRARVKQEFPTTFAEALNPDAPLKPLPSYASMLGGAPQPGDSYTESSICLLMALQRDRGGNLNIDQVLTNREIAIDKTSGLKYLVDDWKKPLAFYREPTGHPEAVKKSVDPFVLQDPAIASAGRNGAFDLDGTMKEVGQRANDNLYSFRLRQGGRGD